MVSSIGVVLALVAGFVIWNYRHISRQMEIINPAITFLHEAGDIRLQFYRQMHVLVHYLVFHEENRRQEFTKLSTEIKAHFPKLKSATQRHRMLLTTDEYTGDELQESIEIEKIEDAYGGILTFVDRAFAHKDAGRIDEAMRLVDFEVEKYSDDFFLQRLDEVVEHKSNDMFHAYDAIMLRLGVMPLGGMAKLRQIQGARLSMQYFLAVDRLSQALNKQTNDLMRFLTTGTERNLLVFEQAGVGVERALKECRKIIQVQIDLHLEHEEEQLKDIAELDQEYQKVLGSARSAIGFKRRGNNAAVYAVMETKLKPMIDDDLLSKVAAIVEKSRLEIGTAHREFLDSLFFAGLLGILLITCIAAVLFWVSVRMITTMLSSIHELQRGTTIIGSGNLDHRILVKSQDELGELAASFNAMADSLKESNDELTSFIFSISHDLRAPLVNIQGFSGELRRDLDAILPDVQAGLAGKNEVVRRRVVDALEHSVPEALRYIDASATRIDLLVNAVLRLSRIGRRELKPEPINMTQLVQTTLELFAHQIAQGNITVTIGPLPDVVADRLVMEQSILNLLDNALKYLEPGRPGVLELTAETVGTETVFNVRDNGRGIDPQDLQKIFEIFRRAGKPNIPGEGMGLAFVKALVRLQGGRIWCESEPGKGTLFSFTVPFSVPGAP